MFRNDLSVHENAKGVLPYSMSMAHEDGAPQTIIVRNFDDFKRQLFEKYGSNFMILDKKPKFTGGFLGFGQKQYWEVKYSVGTSVTPREAFKKNRDEILVKTSSEVVASTKQIAALDKKIEEYQKKIDMTLKSIESATNAGDKHPSVLKIEELLQKNEFTFSYINSITTRLRSELSMDELDDFKGVQKKVVDWIGESIHILPKIPHKYPYVVIIVGPTGVGKTTTIAKLAGTMIMEARSKGMPEPVIRMITIDHTRVGAEAQLNRYGDIMNVKVDKAESADDVRKLFDTYKNTVDIFFIDTPGYSPNDFQNIGKMRDILKVKGINPEISLALTASSKARDLVSIIQSYENFGFSSVIITKWDETSAFGNVISVLSEKGKSVSYITDGQQVPKRIERATVLKFLLNLNDFEIDRIHIEDMFPEEK